MSIMLLSSRLSQLSLEWLLEWYIGLFAKFVVYYYCYIYIYISDQMLTALHITISFFHHINIKSAPSLPISARYEA